MLREAQFTPSVLYRQVKVEWKDNNTTYGISKQPSDTRHYLADQEENPYQGWF